MLAGGDHYVVFIVEIVSRKRRAIAAFPGSATRQPDQPVGLAGHRRNDHGHAQPRLALRRDQTRDARYPFHVANGRAAELHDQARHYRRAISMLRVKAIWLDRVLVRAEMWRMQDASLDPAEIEKFSALAAEWWNPAGPFGALHRLNPVRLSFIRDVVMGSNSSPASGGGAERSEAEGVSTPAPRARGPLAGLSVLDLGCGGGLVSAPLARMGAIGGVTQDPAHAAVADDLQAVAGGLHDRLDQKSQLLRDVPIHGTRRKKRSGRTRPLLPDTYPILPSLSGFPDTSNPAFPGAASRAGILA